MGVCARALEQVILYDALDLKVLNKVVACRSRVVAVSFSRDGMLLATASEQGTVIRIFTVPSAVKVRCSTYTSRVQGDDGMYFAVKVLAFVHSLRPRFSCPCCANPVLPPSAEQQQQ